jgi:drug/metabolite transporter (DMT)-like permease
MAQTLRTDLGVSLAARLPALGLALLWGLNWPAVRIALGSFGPWTFRMLGLSAAGVLLLVLAVMRRQPLRVPAAHLWRLVASGLLNIAGFNLCTVFAQLAGTTSRATIITYTMPMWTVLFAWWLLAERPDRQRIASIALGAAGLAFLLVPGLAEHGVDRGAWFALGAGASWAAGTVFLKRFPIDASPLATAGWQLLIGSAAAAIGMAGSESMPPLSAVSTTAAAALAYHVIFAMALGYFVWFEVAARLPAGVAALATLMVPVVALSGAMTVLGERPSAADLCGFVLIVAAAWTALGRRGRSS